MKFVVDRIIDDVVVLEELSTKEKREVSLDIIPRGISDGSILKYENESYILEVDYEIERRNLLRQKLDRLKNLK